ncbi:hypothetical protein F4775DRAFT_588214 [Biscogniauxia sp. FL1348]|nr:hypothetical protein F4775DRAFT_588214 [Biscogniauxia sp. FL1348]
MPYKLHPCPSYTAIARLDDDPPCLLTYDHHTSCTACHRPTGLLWLLRALFGGPRARCRHHHRRHKSGWGGGVKGWARRKGCTDPTHRALAFRPWVDTAALPPRLSGQRTRLPAKCRRPASSSSYLGSNHSGDDNGGDGGGGGDGGELPPGVEYVQPFVEDAGPEMSSSWSGSSSSGGVSIPNISPASPGQADYKFTHQKAANC